MSDISVCIHSCCATKFWGNFAFKSPFPLMLVLLLLTKETDDEKLCNLYAESSMFKSKDPFPYAAGPDAVHCL